MKLTLGRITTIGICAMSFQYAAATVPLVITDTEILISHTLTSNAENEPQSAIGFVVGRICPSGNIITDPDLQARCGEIAGAGLSNNPTSNDGLQAMAPEEDAAIAASEVDSGSAQMDQISNRQASVRGGAKGITMNGNRGFNWSSGAAGDGNSP
jgi:hypothetical protein